MNLSSTARQIVFWLLIIAGALLLYKLVNPRGSTYKAIALTEMDQMIQSGNIKQLTVKASETVGIDVNNQEYRAALSNEFAKSKMLDQAREVVNGKPRVAKVEEEGSASFIWPMLITWAPLLFIIAIWIFMLRQMQSGGNKALSFGKSRAKLLNNQQKRVTFKDVAGVEEAKSILQSGPAIHIVFADVVLQHDSTIIDLIVWMEAETPSLPVVLTSGQSNPLEAMNLTSCVNVTDFLPKPFSCDQVQRLLRQRLAGRQLPSVEK